MPIVVTQGETTYMNIAEILAAPPPHSSKKSARLLPLPPKEAIVHTATAPVFEDERPTYNQLRAVKDHIFFLSRSKIKIIASKIKIIGNDLDQLQDQDQDHFSTKTKKKQQNIQINIAHFYCRYNSKVQ